MQSVLSNNIYCPLCCNGNLADYHCDKHRYYLQCEQCLLVSVPQQFHLSSAAEKQVYDQHQNSPHDMGYREFLAKLGISNFDWKTGPSGLPESEWRASLTSRDMVKIGTLAANQGKWQGQQLIDRDFITRATSKLIKAGDDDIYGGGKDVSNQGYGYYWWSTDLQSTNSKGKAKKYASFSAQGGGGMFIMQIPELDLIIVITAHHVEHATQQLIAERILPAFIN